MKKKILLVATGGTIACRDLGEGLAPVLTPDDLLAAVPAISNLCDVDTLHLFNLDSTDMTPSEWLTVAREIRARYDTYDGFVITHGTDTLAYAAATVSCLIRNSAKPIVLTGSQFPMGTLGSDAEINLANAFTWVCHEEARGVHIVFAGRVIRGMRARKRHTTAADAFESVNCPDSAIVNGGQVTVNERPSSPYPPTVFYDKLDSRMALAHLTPGLDPKVLTHMATGQRAMVVEGVGVGGIPEKALPALPEIAGSGVQLILTSQVPYGACDFTVYRAGRRITEACGDPVVTTRDVPTSAAFAAAMWAIGEDESGTQFGQLFESAVRDADL